jgi:hypothetical protein
MTLVAPLCGRDRAFRPVLLPASAVLDLVLALALSRADCQKISCRLLARIVMTLVAPLCGRDRAFRPVDEASDTLLKILFVFSNIFAHPHHRP